MNGILSLPLRLLPCSQHTVPCVIGAAIEIAPGVKSEMSHAHVGVRTGITE